VLDPDRHHLARAQTRRIHRRQRDPAGELVDGFQQARNVIHAQHDGQRFGLPRVWTAHRQVGPAERHAEEEAQARDGLVQRCPGDVAMHQMQLIGADIFARGLFRRAAEVRGERLDGVDLVT
jgi:hypothetical protein